jgi:hypothetical protein
MDKDSTGPTGPTGRGEMMLYLIFFAGSAVFFTPTFIAHRYRYEHRTMITVFNIVFCPLAWILLLAGHTRSNQIRRVK